MVKDTHTRRTVPRYGVSKYHPWSCPSTLYPRRSTQSRHGAASRTHYKCLPTLWGRLQGEQTSLYDAVPLQTSLLKYQRRGVLRPGTRSVGYWGMNDAVCRISHVVLVSAV